MKVRLNKQTLSDMDPQVRAVVQEWKNRYRKANISVETRGRFYTQEDARYTVLNLLSGERASAQAAGEFSLGSAQMRPGAECQIPAGCVVIEQGFFLGVPFLNIYQGTPKTDSDRLIERVANLNPHAGEIGAGMLNQLVTEARRIAANH